MQDDVERLPQHIKGNCPYCGKSMAQADTVATLQAQRDKAVEGLEWYGEQARLCQLIHSEGDAGRNAIAADGGRRAQAIIKELRP